MSYHRARPDAREHVECDHPIRGEDGVVRRCGRRTRGQRNTWHGDPADVRDLFDLPRGWSTAPYSDDFDHGATRRSLLDGAEIKPLPWLVGITGTLHDCPACRRRVDLGTDPFARRVG